MNIKQDSDQADPLFSVKEFLKRTKEFDIDKRKTSLMNIKQNSDQADPLFSVKTFLKRTKEFDIDKPNIRICDRLTTLLKEANYTIFCED